MITDRSVEELARVGHGAIEVDEGNDETKLVVLGGPIKHWWSLPKDEWGKGIHGEYLLWRDAIETLFVTEGFLVYCPYKAWRGSWSSAGQIVNDAAILAAHAFIDLTPDGIPAEGTQAEEYLARMNGIPIYYLPPDYTIEAARVILKVIANLDVVNAEVATDGDHVGDAMHRAFNS